MAADGALFGQIIFYRPLQGSFRQLRAMEMGLRQLTYLIHDGDHSNLPQFINLPVTSQHRRRFNAGFAERAAVGPTGGVGHPAILELQGNFHGITAVSGDSGAAIRILYLLIGQVMKTEPTESKKEKDKKGQENIEDFHNVYEEFRTGHK